MTKFQDFDLHPTILKALTAEGYTTPTPIQAQAIAPLLAGQDILGLAQTGTGKTAAFALPILHRLAAEKRFAGPRGVRCLVLAPTRELAAQICDSFRAYGRGLGVSAQVVFGGVPIGKQIRALERGVDVLVATPGRLLDLAQQRAVRFENCEILVLDEADHMLDIGFIVPIRRIVKMIPTKRQSAFFSATMPSEIRELAGEILYQPVEIAVTPVATTAERVAQSVIFCEQGRKQDLLAHLAADPAFERVIVFVRMKHQADRVVDRLEEAGIDAVAIHGNKSQGQRVRALDAFKRGDVRLLIATDIAARGIDVDGVSHVVNYDLPDVPEAYVHRIGRTARAGREGVAISFCARDERANLKDIERLTRQRLFVAAHPLGDATGPDPVRAERRDARPQQRKPHATHARSGPRGDHLRAEHPRGDHKRPDHHRPEHNKPEHNRSAHNRPEQKRPEHHRSEHHRPEQYRGEAQRSDSARSDYGRGPQREPNRPNADARHDRGGDPSAKPRSDRTAPRGRDVQWSNQDEPQAGARPPRRGAGRPR